MFGMMDIIKVMKMNKQMMNIIKVMKMDMQAIMNQ
jgi:hypothetical protein